MPNPDMDEVTHALFIELIESLDRIVVSIEQLAAAIREHYTAPDRARGPEPEAQG